MKVQIRAVAPQGVEVSELPFGGRRIPQKGPNGEDIIVHVSGRFFPTGSHREIEVLDQAGAPTGTGPKNPYVIPLAVGLISRDGRALKVQLEDTPATDATCTTTATQ